MCYSSSQEMDLGVLPLPPFQKILFVLDQCSAILFGSPYMLSLYPWDKNPKSEDLKLVNIKVYVDCVAGALVDSIEARH